MKRAEWATWMARVYLDAAVVRALLACIAGGLALLLDGWNWWVSVIFAVASAAWCVASVRSWLVSLRYQRELEKGGRS
ncbi:MAG: hypothetical protein ACQKBY_09820 [Verrucomicrobiales bacterium]